MRPTAAQEERMMTGTFLLALALAAPAAEQTAPASANPMVASVRGGYDLVKGHILKAAEQIPEEHYAFKASPDVRSLGQLFGHIADANFMICGMATGQKPEMENIEKTKTSKADLTAALAASFKFCDVGFEKLTAASASETVKFFLPGTHTRLSVLTFNTAHDFEHYGNIVTYMRLKGLVPPSSAGKM
jgi:uncharacterized damage-inducible protein DinB